MRAPVVWPGGKGGMLRKLLPLIPPGGEPYCEPYAGAAWVLFARPPAPAEVLNDLDGDLINLFRVLQDRTRCRELYRRLRYTLYARAELVRAMDILRNGSTDPVERAWAYFVARNQSVSGKLPTGPGNWSRRFTSSSGTVTARWSTRLALIPAWRRRLQLVQIDQMDALDVLDYWDNPAAVFYVDPPYHPDCVHGLEEFYRSVPARDHYPALVDRLLRCCALRVRSSRV